MVDERLFQFSFPERPGALKRFLEGLKSDWNVTLFHYRNFGADVGKVLVGIQVSTERTVAFQRFLHELKFPYTEETANAVYTCFLK